MYAWLINKTQNHRKKFKKFKKIYDENSYDVSL